MMAPAAGGMCCTVMKAGTTQVAVPASAVVQAMMPRPATAIHFWRKISAMGSDCCAASLPQLKLAMPSSAGPLRTTRPSSAATTSVPAASTAKNTRQLVASVSGMPSAKSIVIARL